MSERLRVLHVIPFLWSGAGAVVTRLCESQRARHTVHVATSAAVDGQSDWPAYRRRLKAAGVAHHRVNLFSRSPERLWPAVHELASLLRRTRPDVVHAHAGTPTLASLLARGLAGSREPVVGQMYSWGVGRPRWMDEMDAAAFAMADSVVLSGRAYRERLESLGVPGRRMLYIPWGLPLDEIDATPPATRSSANGPSIGFVGRVERRKGQLELVAAFCELLKRFPSARLDLVGPDAESDYAAGIRSLCEGPAGRPAAARRGLEGRVRLLGRVRNPWPIVRGWDLFVSLSSDEGQGLAILEAMALGVPVAAIRSAGVEDYLADGQTGFELTGVQPRRVARALADVLSDAPRLRAVSRRARRMVETRYGWTSTVEAYERVYAAVLGRSRSVAR